MRINEYKNIMLDRIFSWYGPLHSINLDTASISDLETLINVIESNPPVYNSKFEFARLADLPED